MSVNVKIKQSITDRDLLWNAVTHYGGTYDHNIQLRSLWGGETFKGASFKLKNWTYPVIVMENGDLVYDNHNGHWGDNQELDDVLHKYNEDLFYKTAKEQGYEVERQYDEETNETMLVLLEN